MRLWLYKAWWLCTVMLLLLVEKMMLFSLHAKNGFKSNER